MKILIVGGYGTFGGRLVDLLLDEQRLTIYVAGRSLKKAQEFCASKEGIAKLIPLGLDRLQAEDVLQDIKPELVVDASGPFQIYGARPYILVEACLATGVNYIDLADGVDFVEGIAALDHRAKHSNCFALSGMSSFPVLTAAVVRKLAVGLKSVDEIQAGIAPSPFAGVGLNVIKAIASYSGKPVPILKDGIWQTGFGFFDSKRMVVNVPGRVPLHTIRFALTDVPDNKVLSWDWPEAKSIWMGAGPTPAMLHRLLWCAAGLVKFGVLRSLLPLAPLMNWVINTVRWGEHRGGMIVQVKGQGQMRSWHLLAEGDGGPLIPSMAAEAIIRNCLVGKPPAIGARSGHRDLELEDYAPLFAKHQIAHGFRDHSVGTLYQTVMGEALESLDAPIRDFHRQTQSFKMSGEADVMPAANFLGRIVALIMRFPVAGKKVPLDVNISIDSNGETWTRSFAGRKFSSRQKFGQGRYEGLLVESFGPLNFGMAVTETDGKLGLVVRQWDVIGLPLPKFLMPHGIAHEHGAEGRFNFDVEVRAPIIGRIVRYRGWLKKV
jgi:Domain of unknown function (DUF4166)/Saccharopine dehydrogenase NADP binding domain